MTSGVRRRRSRASRKRNHRNKLLRVAARRRTVRQKGRSRVD